MTFFLSKTYVVVLLPPNSLPYLRRIVERFDRLTALMSVSQNLKVHKNILTWKNTITWISECLHHKKRKFSLKVFKCFSFRYKIQMQIIIINSSIPHQSISLRNYKGINAVFKYMARTEDSWCFGLNVVYFMNDFASFPTITSKRSSSRCSLAL